MAAKITTEYAANFTPKMPPLAHQRADFEAHAALPAWGLWWEMGCGKSKPVIETMTYLFLAGRIDGVLVLAPNNVHVNWSIAELPAHLPVQVAGATRVHTYHAQKAKTQAHQRSLARLLDHPGLRVLVMSWDALITDAGYLVASEFVKRFRTLAVADESSAIANPSAKRTKRALLIAARAHYRRVLNGTPISQGPFDVYAQVKFLEPTYWKQYQLDNYGAFKNLFGNFHQMRFGKREVPMLDRAVPYRNLDKLGEMLRGISTRLLKEEVLDLPPKVYKTTYFEMTAKQRKLYDELCDQYEAELDSGLVVTAPMAVVRMLRLHQITCGYVAIEDKQLAAHAAAGDDVAQLGDLLDVVEEKAAAYTLVDIEPPERNPRLLALLAGLDAQPHQGIVWARFRRDIDLICAALGDRAVRFDGACSQAQRADAVAKFRAGTAQFFVANTQAIGMGITLTEAKTVTYYTNNFMLRLRLQSEDRAHRIGQDVSVLYNDIIAPGTVDERIHDVLTLKYDVAAAVLGDRWRAWLQRAKNND